MVAPRQPTPEMIAYLKAHPEKAESFDRTFGPGASQRYLAAPPSASGPNMGVDVLRSAGRAGGEMLAGMAAVAQPTQLYAQGFNETDPMFQEVASGAAEQAAGAPGAVGLGGLIDYEPQTLPGEIAYYATPYLPLALGGFAGGRSILGPLAGAAGAGTDAFVTEGLDMPREVGAAAGGLASMVAAMPMARRNTAQRLASEAMEGVPQQSIADAIALQAQSRDVGVPLMVPEALPEPGVISLADAAATYPGASAPFNAVMRGREGQMRGAIEGQLDQTAPPGLSPAETAGGLTGAAEEIIGAARQDRTRRSQAAGYETLHAEDVYPARVTALAARIDATLAQTGGMSGLRPLLQRLRGQLFDQDADPITNAAYLESLYKQTREGLNRRVSGTLLSPDDAISAEDAGKVGPLIDELQDILQDVPSYEAGRSTFENISEAVVDPLRRQLEPIIGAGGWKQIRTAMLSPDSLTPGELAPLLQTIEQTSPAAIPNIARVIFERAYDLAFRQRKGRTPPTSGAAFTDLIRNSGIQRQKFDEVVRSVARSQGRSPDLVLNGWNRLLDVLERTATMPGVGSRTNPRGNIQQRATQTVASELVNLAKPLQVLERWTGSRNMRNLGSILADANGVQGLVDLAQTQPNTAQAAYIVNALLQTARVIEMNPGTEP